MKNTVVRIASALILLTAATPMLRAQSADVTGGSLTITLDPALWALLDANGISTTLGPAKANVAHTDTIVSGMFDLATGSGHFTTKGQLKFTGPDGRTVTVLQLSVDTTGPTPVVYGYVYADGYFYNRQTIFTVFTPNPLRAPLAMGTARSADIIVMMSPWFQTVLGQSLQTSVLLGYRGKTLLTTSIGLGPS